MHAEGEAFGIMPYGTDQSFLSYSKREKNGIIQHSCPMKQMKKTNKQTRNAFASRTSHEIAKDNK